MTFAPTSISSRLEDMIVQKSPAPPLYSEHSLVTWRSPLRAMLLSFWTASPSGIRRWWESTLIPRRRSGVWLGGHDVRVDQLLVLLLEGKGRVSDHLRISGFTEGEGTEAWDQARAAGFTESTGLGQDRLTAASRARANQLR